jgi:phosphoribosylamine--glycine ligase
MRVLLIDSPQNLMLDIAMRARDDGHDIKWFFPKRERNRDVGKGFFEIVPDWRDWMRWADIVILADNTRYLREIDAWRKNHGTKVVGATQEAADWELNRTLGQQVFKKAGIPVPPYREFSDYDQAIAYVKREGRRFVSKPCGDEPDKSLSYCAKSPADMVYMLTRWKKARRHKGTFILQEFIPGVEMAVGAWFGPHGFSEGWCENWEEKNLMAGGTGPATGEMGTTIRVVRKSKLADMVLKPLESALEKLGYVGYVDVNCIIDEEGHPWPLEFTMRMGWPTFNIQQALVKGDSIEWLACLADGRDARPWLLNKIAIGCLMAIPDFPYSHATKKEVTGIPIYGLTDSVMEHVHLTEAMMGEAPQDVNGKVVMLPTPLTAGDYVLVVTGVGDTVRRARSRTYRTLDKIKAPASPFWRPDIGMRLKKQLPLIQAKGFASSPTMEF